MKYYVFETTMVKGAYKMEGFREALAGHMAFVKQQFADGLILFSGTKPDNSGGVRVIRLEDDADIGLYWQKDPMCEAKMLDYRVTPFTVLDVSKEAQNWFN